MTISPPLFDGSPHGPAPIARGETGARRRRCCRNGSSASCRPLVDADEWPALARARAARPPGQCREDRPRRRCWPSLRGAEPTPLSPWGLRLPPDSRVDRASRLMLDGLVEVQDEGSQLIALACAAAAGHADRRPVRRGGRQGAGAGRRRARAGRNHRLRHQPRPAVAAARRAERAGARDRRDAAARWRRAKREQLADLAGQCRPRPGRRALLGQRHLAAQSRRPLAADARAARAAWSRCSRGCSTSPRRWSSPAERWSMPSVRSWRAKAPARRRLS